MQSIGPHVSSSFLQNKSFGWDLGHCYAVFFVTMISSDAASSVLIYLLSRITLIDPLFNFNTLQSMAAQNALHQHSSPPPLNLFSIRKFSSGSYNYRQLHLFSYPWHQGIIATQKKWKSAKYKWGKGHIVYITIFSLLPTSVFGHTEITFIFRLSPI